MIKEALIRESLNKWQVVTKFHQKPPVSRSGFEDSKDEDERMDEQPKEKQMTFQEYEAEYNECLTREVNQFKYATSLLANMQFTHDFIVDLFREIETPFVSSECLNSIPESELKVRLACL